MNLDSKIYVAGHRGMVGQAVWRRLTEKGYRNLVGCTSSELDLTDYVATKQFFAKEMPEIVVLAAAKVGGIHANNTQRADFLSVNLAIQQNVIQSAFHNDVKKLLFMGSSCIYPKYAEQPIKETALLTGALEPTNEPYAIAKIAGLRLCNAFNRQYGTNFLAVMPTNLYGKGDNYHAENSHVVPALIRKLFIASCVEKDDWERLKIYKKMEDFAQQKVLSMDAWLKASGISIINVKNEMVVKLALWGSGVPRREFLYSDDLAEAAVFLLERTNYEDLKVVDQTGTEFSHINIGYGEDVSIKDLASIIKDITGFKGEVAWDRSKPDGTPRKLLDSSQINALGWQPSVSLKEGLQLAYDDFLARHGLST